MPKANRKPAHPPMRTRRVATNDASGKRVARKPKSVQVADRPDTDDPRDMLPAEAACGPLTDPIIDEDEDDETPGFGETP